MGSSVGRLKAAAALLLAILIAEIALAIWLPLRDKSELDQAPRLDRTYHSVYSGTFENAAVAADSAICSSLGSYILILGFCSLLESVVGTWLYPLLSNKSNIIITQVKATRWERSRCNDYNSPMQWRTKHAKLWDWRGIIYVNT